MTIKKQKTWLPVFSGFYHTIFDGTEGWIDNMYSDESEYLEYADKELLDVGITYNQFCEHIWSNIDFDECYEEASKSICYSITELESEGIIKDCDFESLQSPKYYNFQTDSINCEITYDLKALKRYLKENNASFKKYLKDTYTSYDGFRSSYSNELSVWMDELDDLGEHELGSILEFILFNIDGDAEMTLYEESNCYEDFYSPKIDIEGLIKDCTKKAV